MFCMKSQVTDAHEAKPHPCVSASYPPSVADSAVSGGRTQEFPSPFVRLRKIHLHIPRENTATTYTASKGKTEK